MILGMLGGLAAIVFLLSLILMISLFALKIVATFCDDVLDYDLAAVVRPKLVKWFGEGKKR
jgi:hypothetical protein